VDGKKVALGNEALVDVVGSDIPEDAAAKFFDQNKKLGKTMVSIFRLTTPFWVVTITDAIKDKA
jgi:cation transport ATPase